MHVLFSDNGGDLAKIIRGLNEHGIYPETPDDARMLWGRYCSWMGLDYSASPDEHTLEDCAKWAWEHREYIFDASRYFMNS